MTKEIVKTTTGNKNGKIPGRSKGEPIYVSGRDNKQAVLAITGRTWQKYSITKLDDSFLMEDFTSPYLSTNFGEYSYASK